MGVQEYGWFMDIVRTFFGFLDGLVYEGIKWILFGIFDLANLTTNSEVFSGIYSRIYVILGIFMAFKLSFSFFQYIIDPESMTGKSDKSLSKLLIRVFVMLSALVFLPAVLFGQNGQQGLLSRAQSAFLPSLPKVIFGVDSVGGLSQGDNNTKKFSDSIEQSANDISVAALRGFFSPSQDIDEVCGDGTYENTPQIESIDHFKSALHLTCDKKGEININIGGVQITGTRFYKYSYMPFVSTVVGVLIALLLLGITIDIAKRVFKLMILEVIAPIPIMSLIDPKGNKDGGAFHKWVKSLTSTFLDIFFKLGLIYIIIVFIHMIVDSGENGGLFSNFPQDTGFRGTYLTILLILGLIFFAKEAPKFIKESMGFKGDSSGLFDDVKTLGKAAGLTGGAVIGTASAVGGNLSAARTAWQEGHKGQAALTALNTGGAGLVGAGRGALSGASGANKGNPFKGWSNAANKQIGVNANKIANAAAGSTMLGRTEARFENLFTGQTAADRDAKRLEEYKAMDATLKAFDDQLTSSALKSPNSYTFDSKTTKSKLGGKTINMGTHKRYLDLAKQGDSSAISYLNGLGYSDVQEADKDYVINVEKEMKQMYLNAVQSGKETNANAQLVSTAYGEAERAVEGVRLYQSASDTSPTPVSFNGSNAGDIRKYVTMSSNRVKSNPNYKAHARNAAAVKKGGK